MKNAIAYFEIHARDPQKAVSFYSEIFGWEFEKDQSLPIAYWRIKTEGMNGGLLQRPVPVPTTGIGTNAYICSMMVDDFDATSKKIIEHGGIVALPKFAIPGKCWQGYFQDTEQNTFGIFQVDENAK